MMEKCSAVKKVCTYCDKDALPDTDPPVCEEHKNMKTASEEATTLKELDAKAD